MAYLTLDFLNKNMYRKYPFKSGCSGVFTNGVELPQALITAIQLTTTYAHSRIYVDKIFVKDGFISVLIRDQITNLALGSFSGMAFKRQQTLFLDAFIPEVSGTLVLGDPEALKSISGVNHLTTSTGELEESVIFCFTPPGVTKIVHNNQNATGTVTLTGNNITFTVNSPNITLNVVNTTTILSHNDRSAVLGNCLTPKIKQINTVYPNDAGNIDIFGIVPISVTVTSGQIGLSTPTLDIDDVCPDRVVLSPPVDGSNTYYTDILNNQIPEWRSWPQFSG